MKEKKWMANLHCHLDK